MHSIARTQKILTFHVLDGWMLATKTHPEGTIHEDGMWLPQWLDSEMVTYAKISPRMVNPRDTAGEREEEEEEEDLTTGYFDINSSGLNPPDILSPHWPSGKASASRAKDPGFESRLRRDFFWSSHTSDLKIDTPVPTLPGAWHYTYRVSTGTGQPGVSILWLGEMESLICNFYLSVAACKIVSADPSLRYTSMLLGR